MCFLAVDVNPLGASEETAALSAIAVYALYRVHGIIRHGGDRVDAAELFRGFVRAATEHHMKSSMLIRIAFKRKREE